MCSCLHIREELLPCSAGLQMQMALIDTPLHLQNFCWRWNAQTKDMGGKKPQLVWWCESVLSESETAARCDHSLASLGPFDGEAAQWISAATGAPAQLHFFFFFSYLLINTAITFSTTASQPSAVVTLLLPRELSVTIKPLTELHALRHSSQDCVCVCVSSN